MTRKIHPTYANYYTATKTVWYDKPLSHMPYAQAGVIVRPKETVLVSYETEVCRLDNNGWLTCTGTYSQTTRKHISAFMKEYCSPFTYHDAKTCYENNLAVNILTGEVKELKN